MIHFDSTKNKVFFVNTDKLADWIAENIGQAKIIDKIKLMLKNYLKLDNVSFLSGLGTSIHLGAVSIRNFPLEVETYIKEQDDTIAGINDHFIFVIKQLQGDFLKYDKANLIGETQTF